MPNEANRQGFELAMVFGIDGVPTFAGCIKRHPIRIEEYEVREVQMAWLGYDKGREAVAHQLERYDPARSIGNGDRTALREELRLPSFITDTQLDAVVRAVLKHFGGMPA